MASTRPDIATFNAAQRARTEAICQLASSKGYDVDVPGVPRMAEQRH